MPLHLQSLVHKTSTSYESMPIKFYQSAPNFWNFNFRRDANLSQDYYFKTILFAIGMH